MIHHVIRESPSLCVCWHSLVSFCLSKSARREVLIIITRSMVCLSRDANVWGFLFVSFYDGGWIVTAALTGSLWFVVTVEYY